MTSFYFENTHNQVLFADFIFVMAWLVIIVVLCVFVLIETVVLFFIDTQQIGAGGKLFVFFQQVNFSVRKFKQMLENYFVCNRFFVPAEVALFHVIGDNDNQCVFFLSFFPVDGFFNHACDVVAIETIFRKLLRII